MTDSLRRVARAWRQHQALIARSAVDRTAAAWATLDRRDLSGSWASGAGPAMVRTLAAAQRLATAGASQYVAAAVGAQQGDPTAEGAVNSGAFSGTAADGRSLAGLLYVPVIRTKTAIAAGLPVREALASSANELAMLVASEVADAGRDAAGVAMTATRSVHGYVRMVSGSACSRCIILAGKHYRWNASFQRHPNCFPAGVTVSGPSALAATRRRYEGELTVIRTASGQELPATGNHPVLTDRGWVPANLLQEGDHVVRSTRSQGAASLVVPHEQQVPARIEDCWRPDGMMPLLHVPTSAEDFHGDGGHGEVDVVLADRLLWNWCESPGGELAEQEEFARRIAQALGLAGRSPLQQLVERLLGTPHGSVGSLGLRLSLFGGKAPSLDPLSLGPAASLHARSFESSAYPRAGEAEPLTQAELAFASAIRSHDLVDRNATRADRWDAPAGPLTAENRLAYAARGADLLRRLTGQVELDRVVEIRSVSWSGHVYNLDSGEGWYSANGLIVSNCHCTSVPDIENRAGDISTDPHAFFDHLSPAQQDRRFGAADARAIREGADIFQVVNARRGLYETKVFGRDVQATFEGMSRRGVAGQRLAGATKGLRLTVRQIYIDAADDRDLAVSLLRRYGYLS